MESQLCLCTVVHGVFIVPSFLSHLDRCKPDIQRQLGLGNSNKQAVSLWVSNLFFFLWFSLPPLQGSSCKKQAVPLQCSLLASACFIYFRWSFGIGESEKDTFLKPMFNFFKGNYCRKYDLNVSSSVQNVPHVFVSVGLVVGGWDMCVCHYVLWNLKEL